MKQCGMMIFPNKSCLKISLKIKGTLLH